MIKFDSTLFHCDYVRLKKITSTYLYVSCDSEGRHYSTENSIDGVYKSKKISKIRIHESVARQYFKNNTMKEFQDLGKFASIAYYGDIVVSIEIQNLLMTNTENKTWVSVTEQVMENISRIIPLDQDVFINGKDIFWVDKNEKNNKNPNLVLSEDGAFRLQNANYLSLSRIGVEINDEKSKRNGEDEYKENPDLAHSGEINENIVVLKTIGSKRNLSSESIKFLNFEENYAVSDVNHTKAVALLRRANVLEYCPNRDDDYPILCYSPILAFDESIDRVKNEEDYNNLIKNLHAIRFKEDPVFLNLNFTLHAGKMIGEKYGYEETEILKISHIIKDTKMISFEKIHESSRTGYPIEMHPFNGLSWLFRFVHKEKNLNEMRDLTALFSIIFKKGFIAKSKVTSAFKEGRNQDDIMMITYRSSIK